MSLVFGLVELRSALGHFEIDRGLVSLKLFRYGPTSTRGCVTVCCLKLVGGSSVTVPIDSTLRSIFLCWSFHHLLAKTLLQRQETSECSAKFIQQEDKHPKLINATPGTILKIILIHIDPSLPCTVNVHNRDS